jgi:hypothetical protein
VRRARSRRRGASRAWRHGRYSHEAQFPAGRPPPWVRMHAQRANFVRLQLFQLQRYNVLCTRALTHVALTHSASSSQPCMKCARALLQMGHRRCAARGLDCRSASQPRQTAWRRRGCPGQANRPGGERDASSGVGRSEEKSSKQTGQAASGFSGGGKPSASARAATRSPHALRCRVL